MPVSRFPSSFRNLMIAAAAAVSLGACGDGYGYGGFEGGYGAPGYYDPYVAADQYDFYASGYQGFGQPYWGWHNGFYYPGTGFYVYDRWRRPHRWRDHDRRHWEGRRHAWRGREAPAEWRDFRRGRGEWRGDRGRRGGERRGRYERGAVPIERGLREGRPQRGQGVRPGRSASERAMPRNPRSDVRRGQRRPD